MVGCCASPPAGGIPAPQPVGGGWVCVTVKRLLPRAAPVIFWEKKNPVGGKVWGGSTAQYSNLREPTAAQKVWASSLKVAFRIWGMFFEISSSMANFLFWVVLIFSKILNAVAHQLLFYLHSCPQSSQRDVNSTQILLFLCLELYPTTLYLKTGLPALVQGLR